MKKFVFRLQVVLDRARQREEDEVLKLARLRRAKYEKEQQIACVCAERDAVMSYLDALLAQPFDPRQMHDGSLQLDVLANDLEVLRVDLAGIEKQIAIQRQQLTEAMRKRKVLERLRDKQYEAYLRAVQEAELRTMEEAVNPRLSREMRERLAAQRMESEAGTAI